VRYPRTHHLPWSNVPKDDRTLADLSGLEGEEVVVTVKMDGANVSFYTDYIHGRSPKPLSGQDSSFVKSLHGRLMADIPPGWRVCGENLYGSHSIHYTNLADYFLLFSIWNERNECISWDETLEWAAMMDLSVVPILYRGPWDAKAVEALYSPQFNGNDMEGYVVRPTRSYSYGEFSRVVGKYVKPNFVAGRHDYHRRFVANELAEASHGL
jgi:hypothetical protein